MGSIIIMFIISIVKKYTHIIAKKNHYNNYINWIFFFFFFFLFLFSSLSFAASTDQIALVFASVFVIVWCGAGIVTLNAALLGGNM
jgi:hypothetical protein